MSRDSIAEGQAAAGNVTFDDLDPLAPLVPDSLRFWQAAQEQRLVLPRCHGCRRLIVYPRSFCPYCQGDDIGWEEQTGDGTIWSYTIVHESRSAEWRQLAPYIVAVVELEPGARMTTRLVECSLGRVRVGLPVKVTFAGRPDGIRVPVFRPAVSDPPAKP